MFSPTSPAFKMLFAISSGAASLQIAPPLVAELPLIVLLAICSEPLLPIPPPHPGPLSVVSTELPLIVLLLIVSVAPVPLEEMPPPKPGKEEGPGNPRRGNFR